MKSSIQKITGLLAFVVGLPSISLLHADSVVTVSTSPTAPASDIALSNVATSVGNFDWSWTSTTPVNAGQIFTANTNFTLDKVVLQITKISFATDQTFTVSLYEFASSSNTLNVAFTPVGSALVTATGTLPSSGMNANSYLTFDLPDVSLTSGKVYGFVFSFLSENANNAVGFSRTGNTYASGQIVTSSDSSGSFITATTGDYNFYLLFTSTIPEPSTAALMLGGLVLVGGVAARHRCRE
jgi:hypothetical protein